MAPGGVDLRLLERNRTSDTGSSCANVYSANPQALQTRPRIMPIPAISGISANGNRKICPASAAMAVPPAIRNATIYAISAIPGKPQAYCDGFQS